jgi:hypothetical protein
VVLGRNGEIKMGDFKCESFKEMMIFWCYFVGKNEK